MDVLRFPLARISLFYICGIAVSHYCQLPRIALLSGTGILFILLFLSWLYSKDKIRQRAIFGISTAFLALCLGGLCQVAHIETDRGSHYIHFATPDANQRLSLQIREKLKTTARYDRYVCFVKQLDGEMVSGKIILNVPKVKSGRPIYVGSEIFVSGKILKHKPPKNPGQFDYGKYLSDKSIAAQLYPDASQIRIGPNIEKDIWYYADALRNTMLSNLEKSGMPHRELHVLAALILGQQQEIAPDIVKDYQYAGAVHILSVSGLHVGLLLVLLNFLLDRFPKNKKSRWIKLLLIVGCLWSFAVLAGFSASVVRSVTMFSFVAIGMHLRRSTNIFHTLLISMLLILTFAPSFLFDVGFQLSYLALFFIVWSQPLSAKIWRPQNKLLKYFWDIITVSFAAQIGTLPLSLYYFHQFPGLFFVTNLVVIPLISCIMAIGILVCTAAGFGIVPHWLIYSADESIRLLNNIIKYIASFENFLFLNIPFDRIMLWTAYVLIVLFVQWMWKPSFSKLGFAILAVLLFQAQIMSNLSEAGKHKEWLVLNTPKNSLIAARDGRQIISYSYLFGDQSRTTLSAYSVSQFCKNAKTLPMKHLFCFADKKIACIDSTGIFPPFNPNIILLTQSPKINLERILKSAKPEIIIADGSNYKSYVRLWEKTCLKQKIPFHNTAEKGYYNLQQKF